MSVYVQNLTTGEVIDDYRSDKVVPPASVMKLLTTAACLETMGSGFPLSSNIQALSTTACCAVTCISAEDAILRWVGKARQPFSIDGSKK